MNWSIIFLFLFLFSLVVLVVGTKNPKIIFPNSSITRIRFFLISLFISFFLLSLSIAISPSFQRPADTTSPTPTSYSEELGVTIESTPVPEGEKTKITNVIDGDTLKTENGKVIRLIGMDAPEVSRGEECYAVESTAKLEELVLNKEVELEKDVSETDRYQRLLRYIWIGDSLINEVLVREGFAKVSTYPPDVKYQEKFREAEKLAREEGKGLWGSVCASVKSTSTTAPQPTTQPQSGGGSFICNCSKTCSQMSSCAEAQYQLNFCGCRARDADGDGIACDSDCQ